MNATHILALALFFAVASDASLDDCLKKCSRGEDCADLTSQPESQARKCEAYLYGQCSDSNQPKKCLDKLKNTKKSSCTKKILTAAIPCLKCEIDCYAEPGGDEDGDDDRDQPSEKDAEKCYKKCDKSKDCKEVDKASKGIKSRCKSYIKKMCGSDGNEIDCLEGIMDIDNSGCPKSFRKKLHGCLTCHADCSGDDEDTDDNNIEELQNCLGDCFETKSCQIFDKASKKRIKKCKEQSEKLCDNPDDIESCLESIKDVSDTKCPKDFRKAVHSCVKCDNKCYENYGGPSSTTMPQNRQNFDDLEKCMKGCNKSPECKRFDSNSKETIDACWAYSDTNCGTGEEGDVGACMMRLKDSPDAKCPVNVRKDMIPCITCRVKCGDGLPDITPKQEECLKEKCSPKPSCIAYDSADDDAISICEDLFDKICGDADDYTACIEAYEMEDPTCPKAFRNQITDCMKCDDKCLGIKEADDEEENDEDDLDQCLGECGETTECDIFTNAPKLLDDACMAFLSENCVTNEDLPSCLARLQTMQDEACPTDFRTSVAFCTNCQENCQVKYGADPPTTEEQICLDNCSNTSSCKTWDNASDKAVNDCEALFSRICGIDEDLAACMEAYEEEDAKCPIDFRTNVITCMKCDQKCAADSPGMTPRMMCEEECNKLHGCSDNGGILPPGCQECLTQACVGQPGTDCTVKAISGNCMPKCFLPSIASKNEACNNCKADCASSM